MKTSINGGLLFIAMATFACACSDRFQVYSDYDPDIDILRFKTYSWPTRSEIESKNNPLLYNELTDKRIKKAVDEQLRQNGYRLAESEPDIKIHYHIIVADKSLVRQDDPQNDSYTPYWVNGRMDTIRYKEGTLIIDLMDSKSCNLIWRGWAVGVIDEDQTNLTEKELRKAVDQIFKNYPKHAKV